MNKIPYFEIKVVKVKKKECKHKDVGFRGNFIKCFNCGVIMTIDGSEPKLKGNWINGENLDKIKFPVPCSYQYSKYEKCFGLLIDEYNGYKIVPLKEQRRILEYPFDKDLKHFVESWDIHILKGKVIIFEEEK